MENSGVLNWRNWSPTRKGIVLGAMVGILISGLPLLMMAVSADFFTATVWVMTLYPTSSIYRLFDWKWVLESSANNNSMQIACVAFLINATLLSTVGGLFGRIIQRFKDN